MHNIFQLQENKLQQHIMAKWSFSRRLLQFHHAHTKKVVSQMCLVIQKASLMISKRVDGSTQNVFMVYMLWTAPL